MSEVPVVVYEEPVFGRSFNPSGNKKRKTAKTPKDEEDGPSIKKLKSEFLKFNAQSTKEKKNYRYSKIVELGGDAEAQRKIPLPLKRKIEAAKKKRQVKDIELGNLDAREVSKANRRLKAAKQDKKKRGGGRDLPQFFLPVFISSADCSGFRRGIVVLKRSELDIKASLHTSSPKSLLRHSG
eukprot:sb/3471574/